MDSFPDIQTGERCRDLMYEVDQSSQCGSRPVTWVDESVVSLLILCVFRSARCVSLNHPRKFPEQAGARTDLGRLSYPATTTGSLLGLAMGADWSLGQASRVILRCVRLESIISSTPGMIVRIRLVCLSHRRPRTHDYLDHSHFDH